MAKNIKFSQEARELMTSGIETLYNATRVTLGPKGRNVIIEQDFGYPLIVNDGVTIAKSIELVDPFENMGASLIIEAATKTNDLVGDGTTTAIILASSLILEGIKEVNKGVNPVTLRKGLDDALNYLLDYINECSLSVDNIDDLENIALISSNDSKIANVLKQAYLEVGKDGIISIEESKTSDTYLDIVKGYSYDKGYLSPYMINNREKDLAELINPLILIVDHKINNMNELVPHLEKAIEQSAPILIICEDIETEVLNTLVLNKLRGVFNCVVTKAPYYGDKARKTLDDLAFITGVNSETSLGSASKVIIKKNETTIIDGKVNNEEVNKRLQELEKRYFEETSNYEKEQLKLRMSKIAGLAAIIKVGASTETAQEELRLRTEDALNATKAAMKSGIIEGGGKVFYELSLKVKDMPILEEVKNILEKTLQKPFFQILENAGKNPRDILNNLSLNKWYDANTNNIVYCLEEGIIDPASVATTALKNAVSIAGIFLTTECAIVNSENHQKEENELV